MHMSLLLLFQKSMEMCVVNRLDLEAGKHYPSKSNRSKESVANYRPISLTSQLISLQNIVIYDPLCNNYR